MQDKNKTVKWCLSPLSDLDSLKVYLEEMALKGWMLETISRVKNQYGRYKLFFGRYKPQKIIYSVEAFEKAALDDEGVTPRNQEFIEMCKAGGWRFLTSYELIHIFFTIDESTVPIQTDMNVKLRVLVKSVLRENRVFIPLIALWVLIFLNNRNATSSSWSALNHPDIIWFLSTYSFFLLPVIAAVLFLSFLYWYHKAREAVASGEKLPGRGGGYLLCSLTVWAYISALMVFISIISNDAVYLFALLINAGIIASLILINAKTQKIIKTKTMPYYFALAFLYIHFVSLFPLMLR